MGCSTVARIRGAHALSSAANWTGRLTRRARPLLLVTRNPMDFDQFRRFADNPDSLPPEICTFPALTAEDCDLILRKADELRWYNSMIARDHDVSYDTEATVRNSLSLQPAEFLAHFPGLHDRLAETAIPTILNHFQTEFARLEGLHLIRYPEGGYFAVHTDKSPRFPDRLFSLICYIDDDYEGGETAFPSLQVMVKGKRGWGLIFPADLVHSGMPIVSGVKTIAVAFLERTSLKEPTPSIPAEPESAPSPPSVSHST